MMEGDTDCLEQQSGDGGGKEEKDLQEKLELSRIKFVSPEKNSTIVTMLYLDTHSNF